jgi:hypothetical protein
LKAYPFRNIQNKEPRSNEEAIDRSLLINRTVSLGAVDDERGFIKLTRPEKDPQKDVPYPVPQAVDDGMRVGAIYHRRWHLVGALPATRGTKIKPFPDDIEVV